MMLLWKSRRNSGGGLICFTYKLSEVSIAVQTLVGGKPMRWGKRAGGIRARGVRVLMAALNMWARGGTMLVGIDSIA